MKKILSKIPEPPPHLSAEAAAWWRKIVATWVMDDPSLMLLESALESFDTMRRAQAILAKQPVVVMDRFGQDRVHPAVLIERDAKGTLLRNIKALGLDLEPLHDRPGRPPGR